MKRIIVSLCSISFTFAIGCSSTKVLRTQENDAMLRVILDPTIEEGHYVQIRRALVETGRFEIIDRRDGFAAALKEQDLQFRSGYQDRFSDREKWAHIGKMYGARGVITASAQCYQNKNWLGEYRKYCKQILTFIDGYTGKVEFSVQGENSEPWVVGYTVPNWDDVVKRAVTEYPAYFKPRVVDPLLEQYQDQSEELAKREREKQNSRTPTSSQPSTAKDIEYLRQKTIEMNKDSNNNEPSN